MLEKQLKTLGQKIRIDILKKLKNIKEPISFSRLQKEVINCNNTSVNFSFHLNALKDCNLIESSEDGYYITVLGKQILNSVLSIEQILVEKNRVKMIRTSKYSKEIFDINKIKEYLIKEGEMESFIAKQIAHEVEERLSKTNIEYLTAPLMREYINAILLENGFEEVRHKLTRLGTPPFEVFKLFNSEGNNINPDKFIKELGSDVSEQFLLLNLLPKNLADLYLTGEIALLHLNYWSLRPLSVYLNTNSVIEVIIKRNLNSSSKLTNSRELTNLILLFIDLLHNFKPYFSQDLVLGDFNKNILSYMNSHEKILYFIDILKSQILKFNNSFEDLRHGLTIDFNYHDFKDSTDLVLNQFKVDKEFLNYKIREKEFDNNIKPFIIFDYSKLNTSNLQSIFLEDVIPILKNNNICFYNYNSSNFLNSALIKIKNSNKNQIILDKILINLHSISVKANRNDDLFLDLLFDKMSCVFDLFKHKESLVKKKLNSLNGWQRLIHDFFGKIETDFYKNTIKSVSFFGLNEAILNHCGIELDRLGNSEEFALRILSFMKKLIREKNQEENNYYILSQPHNDTYLHNAWHNGTTLRSDMAHRYSSSIIRHNSKLPLAKRVNLFKKFEKVINGGIIFDEYIDINGTSIKGLLSNLFKSELEAICIQKRIKI
ncbi:MAG: anaerobic ribonucleoside-triphosphate reductase [Promethearchaeota archaeon]